MSSDLPRRMEIALGTLQKMVDPPLVMPISLDVDGFPKGLKCNVIINCAYYGHDKLAANGFVAEESWEQDLDRDALEILTEIVEYELQARIYSSLPIEVNLAMEER